MRAGIAVLFVLFAIFAVAQNSSRAPNSRTPYIFQTADGKCSITIDTSAAPDLTDWTEHKLAPVLADWYPKIVAMLPSPGFTAPSAFSVTVKPMDGVAYTTDTKIFVSEKWIQDQMNGEAIGSLVHETAHVVQRYNGHEPSWLVEGVADYVRWFKYEPQSHGADIVWMRTLGDDFSPRYDASYRVSANFLNWVSENYDSKIVMELNAELRAGKYTDDFWKRHTKKTVQELGDEWKAQIQAQLQSHPNAATGP
jgi:hypothetical protein